MPRSKNLALNSSAPPAAVPIHTAGEVFADGILELVRDRRSPAAFQLILAQNNKQVTAPNIAHGGSTYLPAAVPAKLAKALILPTQMTRYGSTRELFDDVAGLLRCCASGLTQEAIPPLTYWTFATWFPDCVPVAPCLVLTGDATQSLHVLRVLAALSYHGLLLGDVTPAGLRSLGIDLRLTLLIDQRQLTGRLERMLALSNHPDYLVPGNGDVRDLYCAKALYVGDRIPRALADGSLHVAVSPGDGSSMNVISSGLRLKAEELQNKLLRYRMQTRSRVSDTNFIAPELTRPMRVLASTLVAAFPNDPDLRNGIIVALKTQDQQYRVERGLDRTCVVIEAVLVFCHEGKCKIYVRDITEAANQIRKGRGESMPLTPEEVGHTLKQVGLGSGRLDGAGNGLVLDLLTQQQVHKLAERHDVLSMQSEGACPSHCLVARAAEK